MIETFDNQGGAAILAKNLGDGLEKKGHTVHYLVGYKKSNNPNVEQINKRPFLDYISRKKGKDYNFMYSGLSSKLLANDIDFGAQQEITNHTWFKSADIVHLHNLHGNYFNLETLIDICKLKKTIWTLHDEWAIMASGAGILENKMANGFYLRSNLKTYPAMAWNNDKYLISKKTEIYSKSDFRVVVPSKWLEHKVKTSVLKNKKITVIPNGIDVSIFNPQNQVVARQELGLPLNKKIITFIADGGQKNSWKGWQYIEKVIKSFRGNVNQIFLSIGGQNTKGFNYLLNIKYIDKPTTIAQYYSASDVLLSASLVESFGLTIVEAAACGTPIVSFPVGIVPEIVEHKKNGYIAQYKDWQELKKGIEYILSLSSKKMTVVSSNLVKKVKGNYSLSQMVDKYEKLYQNEA